MKDLLPVLLTLLVTLPVRGASDDSAAFEQANKLYEEGHYHEAIEGYQLLLTNHPSVTVHFNLGNAYFKSGQIGNAIAEYRQAEFLSPRDPDVLANLRFARQHVEGPTYKAGWFERKTRVLAPREWTALATSAVWVLFALLIVRQLRPKWRSALGSWTLAAGALAAVLLACGIWISRNSVRSSLAVVTQREAIVRLGPFEESQSALTLKNGAEVRVLDEKDGWLQVTTDGKQIGWVQAGLVRKVLR